MYTFDWNPAFFAGLNKSIYGSVFFLPLFFSDLGDHSLHLLGRFHHWDQLWNIQYTFTCVVSVSYGTNGTCTTATTTTTTTTTTATICTARSAQDSLEHGIPILSLTKYTSTWKSTSNSSKSVCQYRFVATLVRRVKLKSTADTLQPLLNSLYTEWSSNWN